MESVNDLSNTEDKSTTKTASVDQTCFNRLILSKIQKSFSKPWDTVHWHWCVPQTAYFGTKHAAICGSVPTDTMWWRTGGWRKAEWSAALWISHHVRDSQSYAKDLSFFYSPSLAPSKPPMAPTYRRRSVSQSRAVSHQRTHFSTVKGTVLS